MDLTDWIARLLGTASVLGGYPLPDQPPRVTVVPQTELASMTCGVGCLVKGAFIPGQGVFVVAELAIDTSPSDRSVLLHELVHYLQDVNQRYAAETPCDRFRDRELEAYHVQDEYLERYALGVRQLAANLEFTPMPCDGGARPAPVQTYRGD
jgi:hypothetical protein